LAVRDLTKSVKSLRGVHNCGRKQTTDRQTNRMVYLVDELRYGKTQVTSLKRKLFRCVSKAIPTQKIKFDVNALYKFTFYSLAYLRT